MSELSVISYRPEPAEFAWTFGGAYRAAQVDMVGRPAETHGLDRLDAYQIVA